MCRSPYNLFVKPVLAALAIVVGATLVAPVDATADEDGPAFAFTSPVVALRHPPLLPAPPVAIAADVANRMPPAECLVVSEEVASDEEHECADWKVDSEIEETDTGYEITVTACRLTDEREETTTYEGGVDAGGVAKVSRTVTRTMCAYGDEEECGVITAADSQTRNLVQ